MMILDDREMMAILLCDSLLLALLNVSNACKHDHKMEKGPMGLIESLLGV